jgi:hypothetical protein
LILVGVALGTGTLRLDRLRRPERHLTLQPGEEPIE